MFAIYMAHYLSLSPPHTPSYSLIFFKRVSRSGMRTFGSFLYPCRLKRKRTKR